MGAHASVGRRTAVATAVATAALTVLPPCGAIAPPLPAAPAALAAPPAPAAPLAAAVPGASSHAADVSGQNACETSTPTVTRQIPWGQQLLAPQRVWPYATGAGVTVAVIDSGVDAAAAQLRGHVLPGISLVPGFTADTDCVGHGTMVAGIIAAQPSPDNGMVGLAPGAMILPIRVYGDSASGAAPLAQAITDAVDAGASVINISITTDTPTPELAAAVGYAERHNVLIVAAAGNEAAKHDPTTYPAAYPGVLAVGAVNSSDVRSAFSETGRFVALTAPGEQIASLSVNGAGVVEDSGTSFAAPFVTATAALVRSRYPQLTVRQLTARLEATADPVGAPLPNTGYGYGVINPLQAVTAVATSNTGSPPPPRHDTLAVATPRTGADDTARYWAAAVGVAILALFALLPGARRIVRRGQARGWRTTLGPDGS